jgi:hypothetical protein
MRERFIETDDPAWTRILPYVPVLLQEYEELFDGEDCVYWYNENAVTSLLAGSIWKAGGIAFQEFNCQREEGLGRADLWFQLDGKPYLVEAKIIYPTSAKGVNDRASKALGAAEAQVLGVTNDKGTRVALCFVSPKISQRGRSASEDVGKEMEKIAKALQDRDDIQIYLSYQTKKDYWDSDKLTGRDGSDHRWPGTFIVGKILS